LLAGLFVIFGLFVILRIVSPSNFQTTTKLKTTSNEVYSRAANLDDPRQLQKEEEDSLMGNTSNKEKQVIKGEPVQHQEQPQLPLKEEKKKTFDPNKMHILALGNERFTYHRQCSY